MGLEGGVGGSMLVWCVLVATRAAEGDGSCIYSIYMYIHSDIYTGTHTHQYTERDTEM